MKCSNCENTVNKGELYCSKCGAKFVWKNKLDSPIATPIYTGDESEEEILIEGKKQLGGIVILLWVLIGIGSLGFISNFFIGCAALYEEGLSSGFDYLISTFFFTGVPLLLFIFAQLGIKKRKPYTVPLVRTLLILGCFSLVGLILVLVIFWKRINNPYAKKYLNYFDGSLQRHLR